MFLTQRFIFQSEKFRRQEKYFVQEVIPITTESHHPPGLSVLKHNLCLSLCGSTVPAILYLVLCTS